MELKKKEQMIQKEKERVEELQGLAAAGQVMMSEREEFEGKERMQKVLYKKAWEEQMKIKKQARIINDELLKDPLTNHGKIK